MSKYAPNPKCTLCVSLGELCMSCALDWKTKHIDDELALLRRIARMVEAVPLGGDYPGITRALAQLKIHRRTKPPRKPKEATPS